MKKYPPAVIAACRSLGLKPDELLSFKVYDDRVVVIDPEGRKLSVAREPTASSAGVEASAGLVQASAGLVEASAGALADADWPPSINKARRTYFAEIGLTPAKAAEMSDADLGRLSKIGPSTIKAIRQALYELNHGG